MTPTPLRWIKSSYSGNDGPDCVEVAISPARLAFTDGAWPEFPEFAVGC
jgi:hypothetical protein